MTKRLLTCTILLLLNACAATRGQREAFDQQAAIADQAATARASLDRAVQNEPWYEVVDDVWVGTRSAAEDSPQRPAVLNAPLERQSLAAMTLPEIAAWLSRHYGLRIKMTEEVRATDTANTGIVLSHTGTVASYLDALSARTGVFWRWQHDQVEWFVNETRSYQFDALAFKTEINNTITNVNASSSSGGGSSGGSGSGSQSGLNISSGQTTSLSASIDPFDALLKDIENIVGKKSAGAGSSEIIANKFLNTITVTATPVVHERVQAYMDQANAIASKQVQFNVKVLSVELDATESYGINWGVIYQDLNSRFKIETNLVSDAINSANSTTIGLINPNSRFDGSEVLLEALSAQGDVSIEQSANVITLNGRPAPIQVTEDTAYLPSVTSLQVPNAGATTSFQGATVTTGFAMRLTPMVRANNDVIVQLELNISNLRNLRQISPGLGLTAEQPEIDRRQIAPQVLLKSGATMVLSGFEQTRAGGNRRGIGSPKFQALGGGTNANQKKSTLVVLITPIVL